MIYAVIDTNVIVSALITHNPAAATVAVVEHLLSGEITPIYNEEILNEYDEVLHRPKFNLSHNDIRALLPSTPKVVSPSEMIDILSK
jgi:putative PIN family toxin of toxin-antitoxin system